MRFFDYYLQNRRISKVLPYIKQNYKILDIGCDDGIMFRKMLLNGFNIEGIGVDPALEKDIIENNYKLYKDTSALKKVADNNFDIITMLAVLEHLVPEDYKEMADNLYHKLKKEGKLIITVPSKYVDFILVILKLFRIIDGTKLEEHHGFEQKQTEEIFSVAGFKLLKHKKFQLGLNNLYVFIKSE